MYYKIRTEISQDCEYTATFLKDKDGRDIRIGNLEGEIITELQEKLHCRNVQIADLKNQIKNYGIGHLSINDLTHNAISFLRKQGYTVENK